jgi:hypothetical protein
MLCRWGKGYNFHATFTFLNLFLSIWSLRAKSTTTLLRHDSQGISGKYRIYLTQWPNEPTTFYVCCRYGVPEKRTWTLRVLVPEVRCYSRFTEGGESLYDRCFSTGEESRRNLQKLEKTLWTVSRNPKAISTPQHESCIRREEKHWDWSGRGLVDWLPAGWR